jgi:hypothetical protein
LFSNFVGGALIAALIVGFFSTADFVYKYVPATKRIRLIAARCSLIGAGALFCGTAYYVTLIFYNPVPAKLEAYFSAPTNGTFIVADADSGESKGNDKKRKFSLLPVDKSIASEINWTTNSLKEVELKKSKFAGRYDVFVNLLSGFCTLSDFKKHDLKGNPLILTNVEGLEFSFDPGMATFSTRSDEENASKHEVFPGDVALFSLDQNEKDKALKLTQFVGNDAFLNVSSNDNERVVLLTASLMTMNGAQASRISRVFNLKSDGRNFTVKFAPLPISDDKKKGDCSTLDTAITMHQQDTTHNTARASNATLFAGALVRIRKHGGFLQSTGDEISLSVRGSSGWIQADGLSKDKMPEYDVGELSMFQVRGNITDLVIDNVSVPPRGLSTYTAIGSLQTEFGSQGRIRVYGTANSLWKDKERLNQTKWEKLDWEPKLFVFGAFAAFISLLWPLVVKRLASNRTFEWMQ